MTDKERTSTSKQIERRRPLPTATTSFVFPSFPTLDEFEKLEQVGKGTFGTVYKAKAPDGSLVALKAVKIDDDRTGFSVTSIREIKTLQSLCHKNVISLNCVVATRDSHIDRSKCHVYEVFPYMEHDLTGLLENKDVTFDLPLIKCYFKQILEGVFHCHRRRIIHRDIKCSNILIDNKGSVKLGDFGLARMMNNDAQYTQNVVTLWYRAPELLLGERKYDAAIDMWSLGCVFAEMLTRKPLFPGATDARQLELIFQLCGSPTEISWKNHNSLPGFMTVMPKKPFQRQLRKIFSKYGKEACDLLDCLLKLDPKQRITAEHALDHEFFFSDPAALKPEEIPSFAPSNELGTRRMQETLAKKRREENRSSMAPLKAHPGGPKETPSNGDAVDARTKHSHRHESRARSHRDADRHRRDPHASSSKHKSHHHHHHHHHHQRHDRDREHRNREPHRNGAGEAQHESRQHGSHYQQQGSSARKRRSTEPSNADGGQKRKHSTDKR